MKKILVVSLPITLLCLCLAFGLMLASFWADEAMASYLKDPETGEADTTTITAKILSNIPSVSYSLIIILFNSIYLKLARRLTIWENHRTSEQHDAHVTIKLILFEFVNTFLALFYIGLYQQDLSSLRSQLFTTLMVQQVVNQVQEVLVPLFIHRPASQKIIGKVTKKLGMSDKVVQRNLEGVSELDPDDPRVDPVISDFNSEHLDSLHNDFMEIWLQFGHVFLFTAVYPLAALIALINNLTELWADRYKLCRLSRKPRPMCVRDIGAWYTAFKLTGLISITTNCILLSIELRAPELEEGMASSTWFITWVCIEHLLLFIFLGMDRLVGDVPSHIKLEMDRTDYHFKHWTVRVSEKEKGD